MADDVNKILDERKKSHGDFTDHARITTSLKFIMQGEPGWSKLTPVQKECLDMTAHKIGRILAGDPNFKDHWDDIAGYAVLVANRCNPPNTAAPANKLYCVACDHNMHVNAAGYCVCEELGCPNAGKKVM